MTMLESTSDLPARVSVRVVIASMAGLWLCYFLITTLRGVVIGLEFQDELLWRRGLVTVSGVAVTLVVWLVVRVFDRWALWLQAAVGLLIAIPCSLLVAQVNQMAFADIQGRAVAKMGEAQGVRIKQDEAGNLLLELPQVEQAVDQAEEAGEGGTITLVPAPVGIDRFLQLAGLALTPYFLLLAWVAIYFALLAGARTRAAERREARFRNAARAAELRSLRYQVNPHFLFNALNSLSSLVMTGKVERAEDMIQGLSSFYRHSLAEDPTGDVDLIDEVELQRHYLSVEALRFPDRLKIRIDVPDDLNDARIPGMILQPLVENSVKYAVAPVSRPVTIEINARAEYGRLVIVVSDDGPGVPGGARKGFGIGLANVGDRLAARFGGDAMIVSGPIEGGYRSELRLPLVHDE
jgi:signal transduction histidine kinase